MGGGFVRMGPVLIMAITFAYSQVFRQAKVLDRLDLTRVQDYPNTVQQAIQIDDSQRRLRLENLTNVVPMPPISSESEAATSNLLSLRGTGKTYKVLSWRDTGLFDVDAAPSRRMERFPSVDQRVRFYMSSWYAPPCPDSEDGMSSKVNVDVLNTKRSLYGVRGLAQDNLDPDVARLMYVSNVPAPDRIFALDQKQLELCANSGGTTGLSKHYCPELLNEVLPLWGSNNSIPLFVQVGDSQRCIMGDKNEGHNTKRYTFTTVPHLAKTRFAWEENTWQDTTHLETACPRRQASQAGRFERIIWKLKRNRHFKDLDKILALDTIPWEEKKDAAIFRGVVTGSESSHQAASMPMEERCKLRPRCAVVGSTLNSTFVDAKLIRSADQKDLYPPSYYADRQSTKEELLQYKGLVMLQGNDVSTGLKWAMLSKSVVLMPKPTISSWFMEELLQPYIHYIPINEDMSDLEEKVKWMVAHDEKAQRIGVRGSMWVRDMMFHEDSEADDEAIYRDILKRYRAHFAT